MKYLLLILVLSGCTPSHPATAFKATGIFQISENKNHIPYDGDLVVIFQPPDKFRIVGSIWGQRVLDLGGNGDKMWQKMDKNSSMWDGSIKIVQWDLFSPNEKTFLPPKQLDEK